MQIDREYLCLTENTIQYGQYSIVPIRSCDRFDIMRWRNEQIYHLRQSQPLTEDDQDKYFDTVVTSLFEQDSPSQLLFSYLYDDKCIGYGGLVHINWVDRNAEISFIMDTRLEEIEFERHWIIFLQMMEQIAFEQLHLHKIFTYAFDLRPKLYPIFESVGYTHEATLKQHIVFNSSYVNVVIHSKFNSL